MIIGPIHHTWSKRSRPLRKLALLEKIALFEQIVLKMLRAYACIRSKNFTKKMPKMAVLASTC
ncbi:MAG: hypothetical protein ACH350_08645, partial [Parachlamydiaceae bacterium]